LKDEGIISDQMSSDHILNEDSGAGLLPGNSSSEPFIYGFLMNPEKHSFGITDVSESEAVSSGLTISVCDVM
jgi:hypothetical protein